MTINSHIFWDQDDTVLRRSIAGNSMLVNPSAKASFMRLSRDHNQHYLSAKCKSATRELSQAAGLDQHFQGYFDSRKYSGAKSLSRAIDSLGIDLEDANKKSLYIGNNLASDIIADVPAFVHILDPNALTRDFAMYEGILDVLQSIDAHDYSSSFHNLWKRRDFISIEGKKVSLVKQKLPRILREEVDIPNFESYIFYVQN